MFPQVLKLARLGREQSFVPIGPLTYFLKSCASFLPWASRLGFLI